MSYLSYKYRIYPSNEQKRLFKKTFGCVRLVYNRCLELEIDALNIGDPPLGQKGLINFISQVLINEYPFLKEVDFNALCHAAFALFDACRRYWDHTTNPPVYKSRKTFGRNSFTTGNSSHQLSVGPDYVVMPIAGKTRAVIHRPLPESSRLLSFTISREPDDTYYCSVLFSYSRAAPPQKRNINKSIGLDYCANGLFTDSNGHECGAPRYQLESEKKLKRAIKRLSKKVGYGNGEKPSNNYLKQQKKLNKLYRKTANRRNDYIQKKSTELVNQYDLICVENLNMNEMAAHRYGFGKSTMDNAYGRFLELIDYKAHNKGKYLVKVNRWFPSSQICSHCGYLQKLELNERIFRCPKCGLNINRDHNAAINIRREGMRIIANGAGSQSDMRNRNS